MNTLKKMPGKKIQYHTYLRIFFIEEKQDTSKNNQIIITK